MTLSCHDSELKHQSEAKVVEVAAIVEVLLPMWCVASSCHDSEVGLGFRVGESGGGTRICQLMKLPLAPSFYLHICSYAAH